MRRLLTLVTVPAAVLAVSTVALAAAGSAPSGKVRSVSPATGGKTVHVTVTFTQGFTQSDAPGGLEDLYVKVTSPCSGKGFVRWRLTDREPFGGTFHRAVLAPPPGGSSTWCAGRWRGELVRVTINTKTGDCATEDEPEIDEGCQMEATVGRFAFTVR